MTAVFCVEATDLLQSGSSHQSFEIGNVDLPIHDPNIPFALHVRQNFGYGLTGSSRHVGHLVMSQL